MYKITRKYKKIYMLIRLPFIEMKLDKHWNRFQIMIYFKIVEDKFLILV